MGPRRSFAQQRAAKLAARKTATDPTGPPLVDGSALPAASLLQLIWLASPALPVGGFSYSEGLEASVERRGVTTEAIASDWLLRPAAPDAGARRPGRAGPGRGRLAARRPGACARTQRLGAADPRNQRAARCRPSRWAARWWTGCATRTPASPARLQEIDALAAMSPPTRWRLRWPPAPPRPRCATCLLAYAFGWAENMVQAALKSVPLGQSAGQRILARPGRRDPCRRRPRARPAGQRTPGLLPHAGHPVGPARNPVFPPLPLLRPRP